MPPLVPSSVSGTFTRLRNYSALVAVELGYTHTVKQSNPCRNTSFEKVPNFSNPPGPNQGLGRHQEVTVALASAGLSPISCAGHTRTLQTSPVKAPHTGAVNPE